MWLVLHYNEPTNIHIADAMDSLRFRLQKDIFARSIITLNNK